MRRRRVPIAFQSTVAILSLLAAACGRIGYQLIDEDGLPAVPEPSRDGPSGPGADGSAGGARPESDASEAQAGAGGAVPAPPDASSDLPRFEAAPPPGDAAAQDIAPADTANEARTLDASRDTSTPDVAPTEAAVETGTGTATIDDSVQGTGTNQFGYVGSGWLHCTACIIGQTYYDVSDSWSNVTGDYVTFAFVGTQLRFYGVLDSLHGIGAASIDGGGETAIDFYNGMTLGDQLLWTSPVLPAGPHTFTLRVTGQKNRKSSDFFVTVDRVDIQ
jgi:hypothetical protein